MIWFNLETCSKDIEDGVNRQNMYDFLLVFYSSLGRISYHFCVTVGFMPKWPCWTTVTSEWNPCKSIRNLLREAAHRQTGWQNDRCGTGTGTGVDGESCSLKAVLNVFFSLHHLNCLYLLNTKWYLLQAKIGANWIKIQFSHVYIHYPVSTTPTWRSGIQNTV